MKTAANLVPRVSHLTAPSFAPEGGKMRDLGTRLHCCNGPFPSSLVFLFQNEFKCESIQMKMSSACRFIFMQIKLIFITKVSCLYSFWNRVTRQLGNGLFYCDESLFILFPVSVCEPLGSYSSRDVLSSPNLHHIQDARTQVLQLELDNVVK